MCGVVAMAAAGCGASVEVASGSGTEKDGPVDAAAATPDVAPPAPDGSSTTPVVDVDVTGAWHQCGGRTTFAADGSFRTERFVQECEETGTWQIEGDSFDRFVSHTTCERSSDLRGAVAVRRPDVLLLFHEQLHNGRLELVADQAKRQQWRIEGPDPFDGSLRSTIARIVGVPGEGVASACYWSADGECGGLFSCSGSISQWDIADGKLVGSASCSGDCPCGAALSGTLQSDGTLVGKYFAAACDKSVEGTFTAFPEPAD